MTQHPCQHRKMFSLSLFSILLFVRSQGFRIQLYPTPYLFTDEVEIIITMQKYYLEILKSEYPHHLVVKPYNFVSAKVCLASHEADPPS
mmetsp:Transcript_24042/g.66634  ORF Transcript_24042/g.66634 Transcript_24042/m.66634 type:complete len:89 (+) Transcript_24042:185-451(+)